MGTGPLLFQNSPVPFHATWQTTCLSSNGLVGNTSVLDEDIVQVLSLLIEGSSQETQTGFTISYQQLHKPAITHFDLHPTVSTNIIANIAFWRAPPDTLKTAQLGDGFLHSSNGQQKILHIPFEMIGHLIKWEVETVKHIADKAIKACHHHFASVHTRLDNFTQPMHAKFCQKKGHGSHGLGTFLSKPSHATSHPLEKVVETSPQSHLASPTIAEFQDSTNTLPSPTASQIRSLTKPKSSNAPQYSRLLDVNYDRRSHYLETLGILSVVVTFIVWLIRYIRDPRRRADRAARREERRNRRLYRRAAQVQKWRKWIYNLRHKYCPIPQVVDSWDEKRIRVLEQENVLEAVMKDEMCALRHAHIVVNGISAAEEGRNNYEYEAEPSRRRRSVATLPGYESEGTQPPAYDEEAINVVDGFRYRPAANEDTPDSSVISTSPRISRDGRDSDLGRELEWRLDSRPPFDFRD